VLCDEGAFLFDLGRKEWLLEAMKRAIARKHDLELMGAHNSKVAEQWSWEKIAGLTLTVYTDILGNLPGSLGAGAASDRAWM
jgi:hypothetical protein